MASKFVVRAVQRPGHDGAWRCGRKWPTAPTEIEVVDTDADPPLPDPGKDAEGKPAKPAPRTVFGKKSFEVIRTDANLNVVPAGDPMALANLGEQNAALKAENDRLKARIAELEAGAQAEQSEARPARKK